jgi:hypothetical protein
MPIGSLLAVGIGYSVTEHAGAAVGVGVAVGGAVGVAVGVAAGVGVTEGFGVGVDAAVGVGVGVALPRNGATLLPPDEHPAATAAQPASATHHVKTREAFRIRRGAGIVPPPGCADTRKAARR